MNTVFLHPVFPQEIFDIIIDNLFDDKPSLKTCSLVALGWRSPSQRLLHQEMVFSTVMPSFRGRDECESVRSSEEKLLALLDTSIHLLRCARTFVFRGDSNTRVTPGYPGVIRTPKNPSLVAFLRTISTLPLPSLASVEIQELTCAKANVDLQRELSLLVAMRPIKHVRWFNSTFPYGIQWLGFVGPNTRSLQVNAVTLNFSAGLRSPKSINDIPGFSAPNLTDLDMEDICGGTVINWILRSPNKALDNPSTSSTSNATCLRGRSWRESITTLSLRRCSGKHALKLIQACSSLKTLNISPQRENPVAPFPFDEILRLPTLEYVYIQSHPSVPFSWLISSFRPSNLSSLSPYHTVPAKPKIVSIDMPVELSRTATTSFRTTVSELLVKIPEFDDVVSLIPGVEVNLKITILEPSHQDDQASIEHEEHEDAKTTLAGLGTDMKVLKLEVF